MRAHITELITLDTSAHHRPSPDVLDLVRLNVPAVVDSEEQAVYVLTALGRDRDEAVRHVRYCVTGKWESATPGG